MIKKDKTNFWDELTISQQDEIKQGIKELDEGKSISWEKFLKKHQH